MPGEGRGPVRRRAVVRLARRLRPGSWTGLVLDGLAVVGVVVLLVLPAAAVSSVSRPAEPGGRSVALGPLPRGPAGDGLRAVPVFTGAAVRDAVGGGTLLSDPGAMVAAVDRQARAEFGPSGAGGLVALARDRSPVERVDETLDGILGAGVLPTGKVAGVNDLAGLLVLAQVRFGPDFPFGARVAHGLYDRARRTGACDPQLNFAFLSSTDPLLSSQADAELQRADERCPRDPTPLWLLGQLRAGGLGDALGPFAQLQQRYPRSAVGWSGEADALVRRGARTAVAQPFSGERDFRRARALYQRAEGLDPDPGLIAGEASAVAGLREVRSAVELQRRALDRAPDLATFQVRLVDYLERDHRFGEAARFNAASLGRGARMPDGRSLIASGVADGSRTTPILDDSFAPISLGAGRVLPVTLNLTNGLPPTDAVEDISFIPPFRSVAGVTGRSQRGRPLDTLTTVEALGRLGCREAAYRRDLVLAGRPAAALGDLPPAFETARSEIGGSPDPLASSLVECSEGENATLTAVARFERGDRAAALRDLEAAVSQLPSDAFPAGTSSVARLWDASQNLWRYAGDLDRAAEVADEWLEREPADPLAADRAGEIAYLQRRYRRAADHFEEAATRARGPMVATERLKQGAAVEQAGDLEAARRLLRSADALAGDAIEQPGPSDPSFPSQALLDSYNARVQAGDTELRDHRYAAAEDRYRAARARQAQLAHEIEANGKLVGTLRKLSARDEPLFRPEVLENNHAVVLFALDRLEQARRAASAAVSADPANPIFLANRGAIEARLGDLGAAERSYRAALASDPTSFTAANNLGVLLGEDGHLSAAADLFRRAIAADDEYATAHFNLGLVLHRMGPARFVEAQGELAEAGRLDPELREHDHELIVDEEAFFTKLDLSKPLPPAWHVATSERRATAPVAGAVLALLLLRVVWAFVRERVIGSEIDRSLDLAKQRLSSRLPGLGPRLPGGVALVLVAVVFLFPLTRSSGVTRTDIAVLALGVSVMALAFMRLRTAIARRASVRVRHYPCVPAVVVGGLSTLALASVGFGVGFAPMPATSGAGELPPRARWLSTGLLGVFSAALLGLGRLTLVPFTTQFGLIGLVMTGSALVPVEPYDGALLDEGHKGLIIGLALVGLAVLVENGVL